MGVPARRPTDAQTPAAEDAPETPESERSPHRLAAVPGAVQGAGPSAPDSLRDLELAIVAATLCGPARHRGTAGGPVARTPFRRARERCPSRRRTTAVKLLQRRRTGLPALPRVLQSIALSPPSTQSPSSITGTRWRLGVIGPCVQHLPPDVAAVSTEIAVSTSVAAHPRRARLTVESRSDRRFKASCGTRDGGRPARPWVTLTAVGTLR
jgi:hypothetical protein